VSIHLHGTGHSHQSWIAGHLPVQGIARIDDQGTEQFGFLFPRRYFAKVRPKKTTRARAGLSGGFEGSRAPTAFLRAPEQNVLLCA